MAGFPSIIFACLFMVITFDFIAVTKHALLNKILTDVK